MKRNIKFGALLITSFLCLFSLGQMLSGDVPLPEGKIIIVFRNDDPSAISNPEQERKVLEIFKKYHVPQVVGVIPVRVRLDGDSQGSQPYYLVDNTEMFTLLKQCQQEGLIEIAQHGYTHETNYLNRQRFRESEFQGLPYEEQHKRITQGKHLLEQWFGVSINTLIMPWNRYDAETVWAAETAGIKILLGERMDDVPISVLTKESAPLLLVHTIELNRFDPQTGEYLAALENFSPAFISAKDFIKRHQKETLFMDVLYHSDTIKTTNELTLLNEILKTVVNDEQVIVMRQEDLVTKFPEHLKNLFFAKSEALSEINKILRILSYFRLEGLIGMPESFDVFNTEFYFSWKQRTRWLYYMILFLTCCVGLVFVRIYFFLIKSGVVKHFYTLTLAISGVVFYSIHIVLECSKSRIGTLGQMLLVFEGTVVLGFILAWYVSRKKNAVI